MKLDLCVVQTMDWILLIYSKDANKSNSVCFLLICYYYFYIAGD